VSLVGGGTRTEERRSVRTEPTQTRGDPENLTPWNRGRFRPRKESVRHPPARVPVACRAPATDSFADRRDGHPVVRPRGAHSRPGASIAATMKGGTSREMPGRVGDNGLESVGHAAIVRPTLAKPRPVLASPASCPPARPVPVPAGADRDGRFGPTGAARVLDLRDLTVMIC